MEVSSATTTSSGVEKICVGVRVRPLNQRELEGEQTSACDVKSNTITIIGRESYAYGKKSGHCSLL